MAIASQEFMPQSRARSFDTRLFLGVVALCILVSNLTLFYVKRDGLAYRDFKSFYASAQILRSHRGAEIYDYDLQGRVEEQLLHIRPEERTLNNHPAFELLIFLPLTSLSYAGAFYIWLVISSGLGIASAALLDRELKRLSELWRLMPYALVVCLFPFFMVVLEGQDSAVALLLLIAAWLALRRRADSWAGFWLGLGLFKFQVFIPLAVIMVFRRPRLLKGFGVSAALAGLISLMMVGPGGAVSYLRSLTQMAHASSQGVSYKFGMDPRLLPNLRGLAYGIVSGGRGSLGSYPAMATLVVVALASLLVLGWAVRLTRTLPAKSREAEDLLFALAVTVSVLLSFHILAHDLTLLALPFAIVINRILARGQGRNLRQIALVALISLFYCFALYLFLFAWSLVFLLAVAILSCAVLISQELTAVMAEEEIAAAAVNQPESHLQFESEPRLRESNIEN